MFRNTKCSILRFLPLVATFGLLLFFCACGGEPLSDETPKRTLSRALLAYQESDATRAYELALPYQGQPLGKLIVSLAEVHDQKVNDLKSGLQGLRELFEDESVDPQIRAEAGLSYGRTISVFRERNMHGAYASVDLHAVFDGVVALDPSHGRAATAALYRAELDIYDPDPSVSGPGFEYIEAFIAAYKGDPQDLVPLRLFVERLYVFQQGDYAASVRHLEAAWEAGISNATTAREVLYRMARMGHLKLGDRKRAIRYYEQFCNLYPYSTQISLVLQYLEDLGVEVDRSGL